MLICYTKHGRKRRSRLFLKGIDKHSGKATLQESFCLTSEKVSILKEKNLLPLEANYFLLKQAPISEGLWCETKQIRSHVNLSPL